MKALDTLYQVETPEGIDLHADLAGPVPRALAYAIDVSLRGAVLFVLWIVFALVLGEAGVGLWLVTAFLGEWFYPVLFEVYRNGQTPGKKWLGLAVVNDDLTPVLWSAALVRNLLRAVDFLPFSYVGGLIAMALNTRFQRLGDMAAGTLVVHRSPARAAAALPECRPRAPFAALAPDDQIALIDFAQRHRELSAERQRELAGILEELTHQRGDAAVEHLRGIGAWLAGAR